MQCDLVKGLKLTLFKGHQLWGIEAMIKVCGMQSDLVEGWMLM